MEEKLLEEEIKRLLKNLGGLTMSEKTYQKAKKIILENKGLAHFAGKKPIRYIEKAESMLDLKISGSYLDFLQTFGAGNFGSKEVFGIIDDDFENSSVPDAIWYTLTLRKSVNLPPNYLVIYEVGDGDVFCLDFNNQDKKNEPKVIVLDPGFALENQSIELIADDFGDFLLELVEAELDE